MHFGKTAQVAWYGLIRHHDFFSCREKLNLINAQGLNLGALTTQRKFSFVDGLSRLFIGAAGAAPGAQGHHAYLESPRMADVAKSLHAAVDQHCAAAGGAGGAGGGKVVLVLDQPDLWLATAGPGDGVTSGSLRDLVLDLREVSYLSLGLFVV